jgi:alpha-tubulin suppressor-like RCC1 family protein
MKLELAFLKILIAQHTLYVKHLLWIGCGALLLSACETVKESDEPLRSVAFDMSVNTTEGGFNGDTAGTRVGNTSGTQAGDEAGDEAGVDAGDRAGNEAGTDLVESQTKLKSMDLAWEHGCAITQDQKVVCWGRNDYGQIYPPQSDSLERLDQHWFSDLPLQSITVGRAHSCGLTLTGTVLCWGRSQEGQIDIPNDLQEVIQVETGWHNTCALQTNGQVKCWGENDQYQNEVPSESFQSISLGKHFACGITDTQQLRCWGRNDYAQSEAPAGQNFQKVVLSLGYHACALTTTQEIMCWGDSNQGKTFPPQDLYQDVTVGQDHACGLTISGETRCWGEQKYGQAGIKGSFTSIYAGVHVNCGIQNDGNYACWGALNADEKPLFNDISVGLAHACGVKVDGSLSCWGWPRANRLQPPQGEFDFVASGWEHNCALRRDGSILCWGVGLVRDEFERDGDFDQSLPPLAVSAGGLVFKSVEAGAHHNCALSMTDEIRCWGDNRFGQSDAPATNVWIQVDAGGWHSCGLNKETAVVCWGDNRFGQSNVPTSLEGQVIKSISTGLTHTCATLEDGQGLCWGDPSQWKQQGVRLMEVNDNQHSMQADFSVPKVDDLGIASLDMEQSINEDMNIRTADMEIQNADMGVMSDDMGTSIDMYMLSIEQNLTQTSKIFIAGYESTCRLDMNSQIECFDTTYQMRPIDLSALYRQVSMGTYYLCALESDLHLQCRGHLETP